MSPQLFVKVAATRSGNLEEKIEEGKTDLGKKREEGQEGGRERRREVVGQPAARLNGAGGRGGGLPWRN